MNLRFAFIAFFLLFIISFFIACEPLVTRFEDSGTGKSYTARKVYPAPSSVESVKVMTWNIRYGAGRLPWFGDSCGDRVILSESEVNTNLQGLADVINELQPDILLLQEVDIQSKRSAYIDQVRWLLDRTELNYGVFASNWKAQFVPSDGLGRVNMGNAVLSRWPIVYSKRIQLPLRGDQDALTTYFYLRRNILLTRIELPGVENFYAVATHLSAFSTDDTKRKQVNRFIEELQVIVDQNGYFVAGGDLNLLPPGSDSTDFCMEDKCSDESFHRPGDDPYHKEGSYFDPEMTWLQPLYDRFQFAVPLAEFRVNQQRYLSHSPDKNRFWDRKLDYLLTNHKWISGSDSTHQQFIECSDHVAVSAEWEVPNEK